MTVVNKREETWSYVITWFLRTDIHLNDKQMSDIKDELESVSKDLKITIDIIQITPSQVNFAIKSDIQLNIGKIGRNLYKKGIKVIAQAGIIRIDAWEEKYLTVTKCPAKATEDQRINRILESMVEGDYYDLDQSFSEDLEAFGEYLSGRRLAMIDYGEEAFLVDIEALKVPINLNCFACTKIHRYGCCCGSPCSVSDKNMNLLDQHQLQIEEAIRQIDENYYNEVINGGGLVQANGLIKAYNGHCSLLVKEDDVYKCISHKYALDHDLPIYDLCPLSCLMYPLEIMELEIEKRKRIIFLTSVVDSDFAKQFGRWGSYESLDVELRCINIGGSNDIFKKEDYKPVYEVNKGLITHEFGKQIMQGVEEVCK